MDRIQRSKNAAFTIYDLISAILIMVILAAIAAALLPATSRGGSGKASVTLNNIRQMGHATAMYVTDYDGRMPLAAVLRPDGKRGGSIGTMVAYPFPFDDSPNLPSPASWTSKAYRNMAGCQVNNSVNVYAGSLTLQEIAGVNYGDLFDAQAGHKVDDFAGPGIPGDSAVTFNGNLHQLKVESIPDTTKCIEWWCGNGNYGWHGRAIVQPWLNCGEEHGPDTCMFRPGRSANQGQIFDGFAEADYGEDLFTTTNPSLPQSFWIFPTHRAPFVKADTSVKVMPMASARYPNVISASGNSPWSDPIPSVYGATDVPGFPSGYSYTRGQALFAPYDCKDADTVLLGGSLADAYSCYFRPDRTK